MNPEQTKEVEKLQIRKRNLKKLLIEIDHIESVAWVQDEIRKVRERIKKLTKQ